MEKKRIFIIAGEKSGDNLGADLIHHLKKELSGKVSLSFHGVGGERMQAAGCKSIFKYARISVMGFLEVLPKLAEILFLIRYTAKYIGRFNPDIVITIDSPDFCFRVVEEVKKSNNYIKMVHYVAPSVWAYRPDRAKKVAKLYDLLFTILPFEKQYFEKYAQTHHLKTVFVGNYMAHKYFENLQKHPNLPIRGNDFCYRFGIGKDENLISITLGSRKQEILKHLDIISDAIHLIHQKYPNTNFVVIAMPKFSKYIYHNLIKKLKDKNTNIFVIDNEADKEKAFLSSNLALCKSGSNTLEFASYRVPLLIFYKTSFISYIIIKILAKVKFANLINIFFKKAVIPEFLQQDFKSTMIANQADIMLNNATIASNQIKHYEQFFEALIIDKNQKPAQIAAENIANILLHKLTKKTSKHRKDKELVIEHEE